MQFVEELFNELVGKALARSEDFLYEGHFTNDMT